MQFRSRIAFLSFMFVARLLKKVQNSGPEIEIRQRTNVKMFENFFLNIYRALNA